MHGREVERLKSVRVPEGMNLTISGDASEPVRVEVLEREPNPVQSTFPSEVLTCRGPDGETFRLFLKRGGGVAHDCHGHRGGVRYEATVYDRILRPIGMSTAPFYARGANDGGWF